MVVDPQSLYGTEEDPTAVRIPEVYGKEVGPEVEHTTDSDDMWEVEQEEGHPDGHERMRGERMALRYFEKRYRDCSS